MLCMAVTYTGEYDFHMRAYVRVDCHTYVRYIRCISHAIYRMSYTMGNGDRGEDREVIGRW